MEIIYQIIHEDNHYKNEKDFKPIELVWKNFDICSKNYKILIELCELYINSKKFIYNFSYEELEQYYLSIDEKLKTHLITFKQEETEFKQFFFCIVWYEFLLYDDNNNLVKVKFDLYNTHAIQIKCNIGLCEEYRY